ncbi:MAG: glycosyltransferase family 9 protein [Oligoflexia bacterium]|nr:glycosyltransferase family 9 protein [Oligoflexia bacterium]
MSVHNKGILITRTDRIGDLILSLPVVRTLGRVFPNEPLYMMVSSYAAPVVENYPGISGVVYYDNAEGYGVDRTKLVTQQLRDLKCRAALMLVHDSDVLSILKKAGIRERYGTLTKLSGIFSYTKWIAQHRSRVEYHELEYNLKLLKLLGVKESDYDHTLELPVSHSSVERAFDKLKSIGFTAPASGYVVIHPTMGGSALNWKYAYYAELASMIIESSGVPVVITGSKEDARITSSIKQHIKGPSYDTGGLFSLKELTGLISRAKLFVGPSTGPMHIAVATSVPVVSIFSPVLVQSPKRWGPYSKNAVSVVPEADCPGRLHCLGSRCEFYNCMDTISVENVFDKTKRMYDSSESQMHLSL